MPRLTENNFKRFVTRGRKAQRAVDLISEKDFQQQVKDLARMLGWKTYHTYDSRRSDPDFPDLVMARRRPIVDVMRMCLPGTCLVTPPMECVCIEKVIETRVIVAELKAEGKNPTPGQQQWLDFFKEIGVETYVWCPSDWETAQGLLR